MCEMMDKLSAVQMYCSNLGQHLWTFTWGQSTGYVLNLSHSILNILFIHVFEYCSNDKLSAVQMYRSNLGQHLSCADPESFVRGGLTLTFFFWGGGGLEREDPNNTKIGEAFQWCFPCPSLNASLVFQGIRGPVLLRNPIFL